MQGDVTFAKFIGKFNLENYPFQSFTAESESERLSDLFISTAIYSPILEAFKSGSSILISGDRGTGKTSIIFDFMRKATELSLICLVDDFSALRKNYEQKDFYNFVIRSLANKFFSSLAESKTYIPQLSEEERVLLTYFFVTFADDATRGLLARKAKAIQVSPRKQNLIKFWNFIRSPLNITAQVGTNILTDIISRSIGATTDIKASVTEYFPEVIAGVEDQFSKPEATFEALQRFAELVSRAGYQKIIFIFDKLDEDQRFGGAAEDISDFLRPMLTDSKFLLSSSFQVVFSLWVVPLNSLKDSVRTQKVFSPEISWQHSDLKNAFDKRMQVFSSGTPKDFESIFGDTVESNLKNAILDLSNRNPRDFWHLMDKIFRSQYEVDARNFVISREAVELGMKNFVTSFNLYEYYPRKANARANSMDVYGYVKQLLKLPGDEFTRNQLNEFAGTGSSTQNYTVAMEQIGLIQKQESAKGEVRYKIRDPKIRYALDKGIIINKAGT